MEESSKYYEEVRLQVPSRGYYLQLIRSATSQYCTRVGFSLTEIRDIQIALGEIVTNIIIHAYKKRGDGIINFRFRHDDEHLTIHVRDFGDRVDLSLFRTSDLSEYRVSGLGLYVVRSLTSDLVFDRTVFPGTETRLIFTR